jgi:hypothetical protein
VRDKKRLWESEGLEQNTIISLRQFQQASDNIRDNDQIQMTVIASIPTILRRQEITLP